MVLDSFTRLKEYPCNIPDYAGRAVLVKDDEIVSFGLLPSGKIQGILCGSDVNEAGISSVRWCKCRNRVVLFEGVFALEIGEYAKYGDLPYVDATGNIFAKAGEGRIQVSNARWVSSGTYPLLQVGGVFVPNPDFYMPLTDNLSFIVG